MAVLLPKRLASCRKAISCTLNLFFFNFSIINVVYYAFLCSFVSLFPLNKHVKSKLW